MNVQITSPVYDNKSSAQFIYVHANCKNKTKPNQKKNCNCIETVTVSYTTVCSIGDRMSKVNASFHEKGRVIAS